MIVVNDRGFHKGYAVADWGCPTCRRIILTNATLQDFDAAGIRDGICAACYKAGQEAERRAGHLWSLCQTNVPLISYRSGVYGIRDDLALHLRGLDAPKRLVTLYRRLGLEFPRAIMIPPHQPEF